MTKTQKNKELALSDIKDTIRKLEMLQKMRFYSTECEVSFEGSGYQTMSITSARELVKELNAMIAPILEEQQRKLKAMLAACA